MAPSRTPLLPVAVVVVVIALIAGRAPAQEQHPIAAMVKASLKDTSKPFTMLVRLEVKEGNEAKLEAAFAKAVKLTRREKGCLAYDLNHDLKTPTRYLVYERWQNLAALESHLKSPHITTLLAEVGELLGAPPDVQVLGPVGDYGELRK